MSVYKRFCGQKIEQDHPHWERATWYVTKRIRGKLIHRSIPEAVTEQDALITEQQIVREAFLHQGLGTEKALEATLARRSSPKFEYIYIFESTGFYKIGRTLDLPTRLAKLRDVVTPFQSRLIMAAQVVNSTKTENLFHAHFKANRVAGEWFSLDSEQVHELKKMLLDLTVI